ncbi:MAG TPA: hypothetical protein VF701_16205 [Thermoanaerobaculia bacterium]
MNELVMMEAALFQIRAAVSETPEHLELRLATNVLAGAVAAARSEGVTAARMRDIDFALVDLAAAAEDLDDEAIQGSLEMLHEDAERLRAVNRLPETLVEEVRSLQEALRSRSRAMERGQYRVEGAPVEPLPHPPEELRAAAIPLARQLAAAGFDTPALAALIADPESLRYHMMREIADELDAVLGA